MTGENQAQHEAWNGESGQRWVADADRRDAVLAPVADALLASARLAEGEDVLDIGCGCGITIAAADSARPGTATGLDLSAPMLELARQRAGNWRGLRPGREALTWGYLARSEGLEPPTF